MPEEDLELKYFRAASNPLVGSAVDQGGIEFWKLSLWSLDGGDRSHARPEKRQAVWACLEFEKD
jgi:hypothetical protein